MPNERFLPFALPEIGEEEIAEVVDSLRSGWITTGPKAKRFEEEFASYIGVRHALAVNSATAGLHLALDAIGLERGDKVITSTYTFTATAEVIRYFDADPIFCDIDPRTFNLDPFKLETVIEAAVAQFGARVKAVIPVHLAGQACEMDKIQRLAQRFNLRVIEDAAHALPTTFHGKLIGTLSDLTVFSFYSTKTITTGEGGMIVTDNDAFAKRIKIMRLHGFNRDAWDRYNSLNANWYYEIVAPGYKYNMTDLAAAMGIHQLAKVDRFYNKRRSIAEVYNKEFSTIPGIKIPYVIRPEDTHAWHLYMLSVPAGIRDQFYEELKHLGISCSVHFIPLHLQPFWRGKYNLNPSDFPLATKAYQGEISLPIYTRMTTDDVAWVVEGVRETAKRILLTTPTN